MTIDIIKPTYLGRLPKMSDTHLTAPTRFVEVDGDKFAYRRWGNTSSGQPPLFFVQHFRGGLDHWDPLLTNGLAAGREVILYNGRGIASSTGTPRNRIEDMADDIALVIRAGTDPAPGSCLLYTSPSSRDRG